MSHARFKDALALEQPRLWGCGPDYMHGDAVGAAWMGQWLEPDSL
jgi:hypothetical protein